MTEVRLRNVDPAVVEVIRSLAKRNGRSLEAEIKDALGQFANRRKAELLGRLLEQRRQDRETPDSTPAIRAEREERW